MERFDRLCPVPMDRNKVLEAIDRTHEELLAEYMNDPLMHVSFVSEKFKEKLFKEMGVSD